MQLPFPLVRSILQCVLIAAPAMTLRVAGVELAPVAQMLIFGAAVIAAAFLLAWAAEAAHKDISGALILPFRRQTAHPRFVGQRPDLL